MIYRNFAWIIIGLVNLFCSNVNGQEESNPVILSGTLKNFDNIVEIIDNSEFRDLQLPSANRVIIPDSSGKFRISFDLQKPTYFTIGRNRLYISPGDTLNLFIDDKRPEAAIFNGDGQQANRYLKSTPFPKGGSYLDSGREIKSSLKQTINRIFDIASARKVMLSKYDSLSMDFRILEEARINADILNSLKYLEFYFQIIHEIPQDSSAVEFIKKYNKIVNPYLEQYAKNFLNPSFLQLESYRSVLNSIVLHNTHNTSSYNQVSDWITARNLTSKMKKTSNKNDLKKLKSNIINIKNLKYQAAAKNVYNKLVNFGEGDVAIDFTMTDIKGAPINLSDFSGKVIYIDIWATWCGPCKKEFPFLKRVKEKYKGNDDIVFVSLSIDRDKEAWKSSIIRGETNGIQAHIDQQKLSNYSITTIPRFIVIDRRFVITDMHGPKPSDDNIIAYLNEVLTYTKSN